MGQANGLPSLGAVRRREASRRPCPIRFLVALNDDVTKERVNNMPYVNIQITMGATREQKAQLVKDVTDSLVRVLGKKPEHTHIVIQEIDEENWGFSGILTDDWKKLDG